MANSYEFLRDWVAENLNATVYHDRTTAENLAHECLAEAERRHLSTAAVINSRTYRPSFGSVCVLPAKGSAAPAFASRMPGARTGQAFQARARRGSRPQPVPLHQPGRQRPLRALEPPQTRLVPD
jgi:hypothetical protein